MKTLNTNIHRSLRFAAAILTMGYLAVAGGAYAKDKEVPLKGFAAGSSVEGDPDHPTVSISEGTGNVSHLGKVTTVSYTFLETFTFIDCDGKPTGPLSPSCFSDDFTSALAQFDQRTIFTAANGDTFVTESVVTGFFVFSIQTFRSFEGDSTIVGGTGRFEGATGSYKSVGIIVWVEGPDNGLFEASFEGTISTVGSKKAK